MKRPGVIPPPWEAGPPVLVTFGCRRGCACYALALGLLLLMWPAGMIQIVLAPLVWGSNPLRLVVGERALATRLDELRGRTGLDPLDPVSPLARVDLLGWRGRSPAWRQDATIDVSFTYADGASRRYGVRLFGRDWLGRWQHTSVDRARAPHAALPGLPAAGPDAPVRLGTPVRLVAADKVPGATAVAGAPVEALFAGPTSLWSPQGDAVLIAAPQEQRYEYAQAGWSSVAGRISLENQGAAACALEGGLVMRLRLGETATDRTVPSWVRTPMVLVPGERAGATFEWLSADRCGLSPGAPLRVEIALTGIGGSVTAPLVDSTGSPISRAPSCPWPVGGIRHGPLEAISAAQR
jgi:hypothetical protein